MQNLDVFYDMFRLASRRRTHHVNIEDETFLYQVFMGIDGTRTAML